MAEKPIMIGRILQVVGFGWALLGGANCMIILQKGVRGEMTTETEAIGVTVNAVAFVLPGLIVAGLGTLLSRNKS